MAKLIAKCPYCGKEFDRNELKENIDWIQNNLDGLGKNRYYHKKCYELAKTTPKNEWPYKLEQLSKAEGELTLWTDMCYDFLKLDLKINPNYSKIRNQLESFNKSRKMKYEGMYKTLRYCYEVLHLDVSKAKEGIGIIPYQYDNAYTYFARRQETSNKLLESINKQIEQRKNSKITMYEHRAAGTKKRSRAVNLDIINEME